MKLEMKIVVSFSNNLVSKGLTSLLALDEGLRVLTLSSASLDSAGLLEIQPDVVITDFSTLMNLPTAPSVPARVLLLDTGCSKDEINYAFMVKQISGVVDVNADEQLLLKAINTVVDGRLWIGRKTMKNLLAELRESAMAGGLSQREKKVLSVFEQEAESGYAADSPDLRNTLSTWLRKLIKKTGLQGKSDIPKPALFVLLARLIQKFFSMVVL